MTKRSYCIFIFVSLFILIYNAFIPLHPDEAYYWEWSRHLAFSYRDGPPLIGYSIWLATHVLGNTVFAIKLVSVIYLTLTAFLVHQFTKQLFDLKTAEIALILTLFFPVFQALYHVTTLDSPLFFFWIATCYSFYLAVDTNKKAYFYLTGFCVGLLLLTKYTGVLLLISLFCYLLFSKQRRQFKNTHLYLAALLGVLIFSPVLIWNQQHEWLGLLFQWNHGVAEQKIFQWDYVWNFIGGQLAIANPVFLISLLVLLIKHKHDLLNNPKVYFLVYPFILPFAFFAYQACFKFAEANWPAPSYLTAFILLAYWIRKYNYKKLYIIGIYLTIAALMIVRFPVLTPFLEGEKQVALARLLLGYPEMINQAKADYLASPNAVVISNQHQIAAELAFYLPGQPNVFIIDPNNHSQYAFWREQLKQEKIKSALYIGTADGVPGSSCYFESCSKLKDLVYHGPYGIEKALVLYRCGAKESTNI